MRAQAQGLAAVMGTDLLVPVGDLDETDMVELVRQPDLRAMIDLMVTWRLPYATALSQAWPQMAETGNLAALEEALDRRYAEVLQEHLGELPATDSVELVRRVLGWEVDQINLLSTLRRLTSWTLAEIALTTQKTGHLLTN